MPFGLILLLLTGLLLTGCTNARETEDFTYIVAMGIDAAPGNKLEVTFQMPVPTSISATGGFQQEKKSITLSLIAKNIAEARNLANSNVSRTIDHSHAKVLIIGEELARQGVGDAMAAVMRFREFRGTIFFMVAKGTAREFMEGNVPILDAQPSRYYDSMFQSAEESGYYLHADIHEFYKRLKNSLGTPYAAVGAINRTEGADNPAKKRRGKEEADQYSAETIPRAGSENKATIAGTALFRGDRAFHLLTTEETRTLAMLLGQLPRGYIVVPDPLEPEKYVNLELSVRHKPRVTAKLTDGQPSLAVSLLVECEITSIPSGIHYSRKEYRRLLEEQISQILTKRVEDFVRLTQELKCDPAGLGAHFRPLFATWEEMHDADVAKLYIHAQVSSNVTVKVRRTGLMWRTAPIRRQED